jgi:hypothetical protein
MGPPQSVFLFGIHTLGNAPAASIVGALRDGSHSLPLALTAAITAFA